MTPCPMDCFRLLVFSSSRQMPPLSRQIVIQNSPPQGNFDNMHQNIQIPRKLIDLEQKSGLQGPF
ncbi:hypothetical protein KI387_037785, partial [Taxus chinensis]